jgi:hypothetical protein
MIANEAFFAPEMAMRPLSGLPPVITNLSTEFQNESEQN